MKLNTHELELRALDFRRSAGLSETEPLQLHGLLRTLGVTTVFRRLGPEFYGMAYKHTTGDRSFRFMLVNADDTLGRQHFTICHELFHLFVQEDFANVTCLADEESRDRDVHEVNADGFAGELLLPRLGVYKLIPPHERRRDRITIGTLLRIEQSYQSSRLALLTRLRQMTLLTDERAAEFAVNVRQSARQSACPIALYEPANDGLVISDYGSMARALYDRGSISETYYLELLDDLGMHPNVGVHPDADPHPDAHRTEAGHAS